MILLLFVQCASPNIGFTQGVILKPPFFSLSPSPKVAISESGTSIPIAAVCGILCALVFGYIIYRGGNIMKLHYFFVASTCLLLLIAAGLFSKAIWSFELHAWEQVLGVSPDTVGVIPYNVKTAVW